MNNDGSIIPIRFRTLFLCSTLLITNGIVGVFGFAPSIPTYRSPSTTDTAIKSAGCDQCECQSDTATKPQIEFIRNDDNDNEEDEDDYACYPPRNPLFDATNVMTYHMPPPNPEFIQSITPPAPNLWGRISSALKEKGPSERRLGVDFQVEFRNAKQGAADIVQQCLLDSDTCATDGGKDMVSYIADILSLFQKHVSDENENTLCKARIVSSVGSAGQKCPRWHVDHVPLRLVMSLEGPGCVYVPIEKENKYVDQNGVNREALTESNESDTIKANEAIFPIGEKDLAVEAAVGDAVLLLGRAWQKDGNAFGAAGKIVPAAPHRSPELREDQLRVLLVVDVVPENM